MENEKNGPLEESLPKFWHDLYRNCLKEGFDDLRAWELLKIYIQMTCAPTSWPPQPSSHPHMFGSLGKQWEPTKKPEFVDVSPKATCCPDLDMGIQWLGEAISAEELAVRARLKCQDECRQA